MKEAYILTGGNLGDRRANLSFAKDQVAIAAGKILQQSSIYQTAAWGNEDQPDFLNQVLRIATNLSPTGLLETLLKIEAGMGRVRDRKNDPRIIDLDILFYGTEIIDLPELQLPHPRLHLRRFVLVPLCEISPELMHPVLKKDTRWLLEHCPDPLNVKKFSLESKGDS